MTVSQDAKRLNLSNIPSEVELENLKRTCELMEQIRSVCCNFPVLVSSGFRSVNLNLAIGGSVTSAHVDGLACDFTIPKFGSPRAVCEEIISAGLKFDQLILEHVSKTAPDGRWVHVGLARNGRIPRNQVLTAVKEAGKKVKYLEHLVTHP